MGRGKKVTSCILYQHSGQGELSIQAEVKLNLQQSSPHSWNQTEPSPDLPSQLKSNWTFTRPPLTAEVKLNLHQTSPTNPHKTLFINFNTIKTGKFLTFGLNLIKRVFSEKTLIKLPKLYENPSTKSELFHADGQTQRIQQSLFANLRTCLN
jgi:hypothetical protein